MKISEQFISSLLARIDIVELIGKVVNLRLSGSNFIGLCPFHQEKTPSFTVNKIKQFFYCFGCKEGGNAIRFSMLTKGHNFVAAVQYLANQYGLVLEQDHISPIDPLVNEIYQILDLAVDYYHQELFKDHHLAIKAFKYLIEDRKIHIDTIKRFKLGLANKGWTQLLTFFQNYNCIKKKIHIVNNNISNLKSLELVKLEQAGLIINKNGKIYDRFRERIIFPIRNRYGKTIGLGARALLEKQIPKYINSPETVIFIKNKELYGLEQVQNTLKNFNNLIIVEGYLDVLSLFQANINNVVATLGTSININHIQTLITVVPEIIFCFDGDVAGDKAAIKAMQIAMDLLSNGILNNKHSIKFMCLPRGYDPDLLIHKKGCKEFKRLINEAKILSDFFFEYLSNKYPDKNLENLNKLVLEGKEYIAKFKDLVLQNLWYERLGKMLGINSNLFNANAINPNIHISSNKISNKSTYKYMNNKNYNNNNYKKYHMPPSVPTLISNATKAICMLLVNPKLLGLCTILDVTLDHHKFNELNTVLHPDIELFIKIINFLNNQRVENYANLELNNNLLILDNYHKVVAELSVILEPGDMQKLLSIDPSKIISLIPWNGMEQEFLGAVKQINKAILKLKLDNYLMLSKERHLTLEEKLHLQQILKEL